MPEGNHKSPIPSYQAIMLPLLQLAGDSKEYAFSNIIEPLSKRFKLTHDYLAKLLPSGGQTLFYSRTNWACTYLKKAGLLEATRRGYFRITPEGRKVLSTNPNRIDNDFLSQYPAFQNFRNSTQKNETAKETFSEQGENTPEELLQESFQTLETTLASDLLAKVKTCRPEFFEKLVVDLLLKMGYGGSRQDAGKAIGKSGDEGLDGIINEDRLGLDQIYIQAKRWTEGQIGRPDIQQFAGALQGKRAKKGIFITTTTFAKTATEYVSALDNKIILIDGPQLAKYMMDFEIGVNVSETFLVKKIDHDFFDEF